MRRPEDFKLRADSVPGKAIAYLKKQPEGTRIATADLARAIGAPANSLSTTLKTVVRRHLIVADRSGYHKTFWRLPSEKDVVRLEAADADALAMIPQRREDDFTRAIQRHFYPPTPLIGQLRDAMWLDNVKVGNPTAALGEVFAMAHKVLERKREPTRFKASEVEASVAHELAALSHACARAVKNLSELLAALDT